MDRTNVSPTHFKLLWASQHMTAGTDGSCSNLNSLTPLKPTLEYLDNRFVKVRCFPFLTLTRAL